jgi:hypothetical protein
MSDNTPMMPMNKHYITIDANNRIIDGFSDAFRKPSETDICINEEGGYQFRLVIGGEVTEENPILFTMPDAIPLYKYEDDEIVKRSDEEIEEERSQRVPVVVPTLEERVADLEAAMPFRMTKTAYIDDTEITFKNVPQGNVTVSFDKPYEMERELDRITLTFDPLSEVTEITISVL